MIRFIIAATAALLLWSAPASAQHTAPYAGQQARVVKSLSEQQLSDLREGRGMGLALPAELNGYPGPVHVIELAERLGLSTSQVAQMKELYDAMRAEAIALGERLIEQEAALDDQFSRRTVTEASLAAGTKATSEIQSALRSTHLKYHLRTIAALTPDQVARYGELRGYRTAVPHHPQNHR